MKLSLSVRIAEAPCKTKLNVPFADLVALAGELDYDAVCLRASAGGVQTPQSELAEMYKQVLDRGLAVSMVTADYDVPLNNERGPNSLRDIRPSLDVAEAFGCDLIRICMKQEADIPHAQAAADLAAERGIRLAHQCHTTSLFEQIGPMRKVLSEIDRKNFGLIYEPANLMLCGEPYDIEALQQLAPHIMNVYAQNHRLDPEGPAQLETFCRGLVNYHHMPYWELGGVDFTAVADGLAAIGYDGYFTIHQAENNQTLEECRDYATKCRDWFSQTFTA